MAPGPCTRQVTSQYYQPLGPAPHCASCDDRGHDTERAGGAGGGAWGGAESATPAAAGQAPAVTSPGKPAVHTSAASFRFI